MPAAACAVAPAASPAAAVAASSWETELRAAAVMLTSEGRARHEGSVEARTATEAAVPRRKRHSGPLVIAAASFALVAVLETFHLFARTEGRSKAGLSAAVFPRPHCWQTRCLQSVEQTVAS
ncbi:hypothetical protein CSUI_002708 [Cystoisospora suis]|uniref:Uncharacterized protein n=1 Tax=Cystoisospora suis TaxID=483139 RepID=A0A2C6L866_9APIC|nr:hypothetical protein CSUI_002708 [Cystoisospora suis]